MKHFVISHSDCYLYSISGGKLKEYPGCVLCEEDQLPYDDVDDFAGKYEHIEEPIKAQLLNKKYSFARHNMKKMVTCDATPGAVYNSVLWLKEQNLELAIQLFISYEKQRIAEIEKLIASHKDTINLLTDIISAFKGLINETDDRTIERVDINEQ